MTEQIVVHEEGFDSPEDKKRIKEIQHIFASEEGAAEFLEAISATERTHPKLARDLKRALENIRHGRIRRVA